MMQQHQLNLLLENAIMYLGAAVLLFIGAIVIYLKKIRKTEKNVLWIILCILLILIGLTLLVFGLLFLMNYYMFPKLSPLPVPA